MTDSPSAPQPAARFHWPAEYYSSETPPPVLPRSATFGCGIASIVLLVVVFAGGAFLSSGGLADLLDFAIGMSVTEMKPMYRGVPAAEQKALESDIEAMLKSLREGKTKVQAVQPFMVELRDATADQKVTPDEAAKLRSAARKATLR